MRNTVIIILSFFWPLLAYADSVAPRLLGAIPLRRPAFLNLVPADATGRPMLVVSTFGLFGGTDGVWLIRNLGTGIGAPEAITPERLTNQITWPNETLHVPREMFGSEGLIVSSGFLVPGRATGAVHWLPLVPGRTSRPVKLTQDRPGWFYHRAGWKDVDADGALDLVCARARKPIIGAPGGELVWLKSPGAARGLEPASAPWPMAVLASGPDVHFRIGDVDGNGTDDVLAAEFFTRRLELLSGAASWNDADFERVTIDASIGAAFDVEHVDLDGDGREDVLATNHEGGPTAGVYAYEVPAQPDAANWTKHTLLDRIPVLQPGINSASPGQARTFYPSTNFKGRRPWILVSGDASRSVHLLVPRSELPGDWRYDHHVILTRPSTIGQCVVGDVDGDGYAELFVPAYDEDKIHVLTFRPSEPRR